MKSIILIGYMCAGKTTIGRHLAQSLDKMFYDLDWYIENRFHKKVSEIFAQDGEAHFRQLEQHMLHEVAEFEDIVLSCGGGTPCFFDNISYMNQVAHVVYLKASPETILKHLQISQGKRPLLEGKTPEELARFVTEQIAERENYYLQAKHVVDIDFLDSYQKIDKVTQHIIHTLNPI